MQKRRSSDISSAKLKDLAQKLAKKVSGKLFNLVLYLFYYEYLAKPLFL